jgi:hypothetical protein
VPKQTVGTPRASGTFAGTIRPVTKGYRLYWRLSFSRLSGPATFAHIQRGKEGLAGSILILLCRQCAAGARGSAYVSPGELTLMRTGRTYVNLRTAKNPAGEIRGQIRVS